jgi:putative transposase
MHKTFSYRIKDTTVRKHFIKKARAVNFVWNFCNETAKHALKHNKNPFELTNYTLDKLTAGCSSELELLGSTIQIITKEHYQRRRANKKLYLRYRSARKSLPWIPFRSDGIRFDTDSGIVKFNGLQFKLWYHRPLQGKIKCGSITADARGRFYLNVVCEVPEFIGPAQFKPEVGIDLGLKSIVTTSDGWSVGAARYYRSYERKLAKAQKVKNKKRVRNIHAKISNKRRDFNHKLSNKLTERYSTIYVGDVSPSALLQKRNLAKSVSDAAWYQLKTFLKYKALAKGGQMIEVSEKYSTQICNACGVLPHSSPKKTKGLSIREWKCSCCGSQNDRDINAALNILSFGREAALSGKDRAITFERKR